jgi:NHL repeat
VKKTSGVLALIALTLIVTTMMTQAATATNPITVVHPFVDVAAIQASGTKIFISAGNVVNIYNPSGKQLGQITGFSEVQGLATDGKGNLYVADTGNSRIQVYAPPYTKTPKTLSDPGQYPVCVSVLNDGEFVAVANIISTSGGPGSVTLFKKGKAGPTISSSSFARVYSCAFDGKGNLYVDGANSSGSVEVGEIAKLTMGGKKLKTLMYNNSILFPGGIQVTTDDKIAILDQEAASIYTFNQPVKGSLGSPVATTTLTGSSDPVTFVFTKNNKDLWDVDAGLAQAAEFAYPSGGSSMKSIPAAGGIAIVPAALP